MKIGIKRHLINQLGVFLFVFVSAMTTEMTTIDPDFNTNCPTFAGQSSLFHLDGGFRNNDVAKIVIF